MKELIYTCLIALILSCKPQMNQDFGRLNDSSIFYFDDTFREMFLELDSLPNNRRRIYNFNLNNYKNSSQLYAPLKLVYKDFRNFDKQFANDTTVIMKVNISSLEKFKNDIWTFEKLSELDDKELLQVVHNGKKKLVLDVAEQNKGMVYLREVYLQSLSIE